MEQTTTRRHAAYTPDVAMPPRVGQTRTTMRFAWLPTFVSDRWLPVWLVPLRVTEELRDVPVRPELYGEPLFWTEPPRWHRVAVTHA